MEAGREGERYSILKKTPRRNNHFSTTAQRKNQVVKEKETMEESIGLGGRELRQTEKTRFIAQTKGHFERKKREIGGKGAVKKGGRKRHVQ